jgi:DNA-binding response OmpR family regulator
MPLTSDFGATMRPSRRDLVVVAAEDARLRGELATRLQEDGYSVVQAASGEEAVAALGLTHAALLISALRDAAALKQVEVPVVIVTRPDDVVDVVSAALANKR